LNDGKLFVVFAKVMGFVSVLSLIANLKKILVFYCDQKLVHKMPKQKESSLTRMRRYIKEFGDVLTVQTDDKTKANVLYCQCCLTVVNSDQRSHVVQHLHTSSHRNKVKDLKTKQISVTELFTDKQKEFNADLCQFMVALNIPFHRISHPAAKIFLAKYTKFKTPADSTLRKEYLKPLYDRMIEKIRNRLADQYIWLQIDETEHKGQKVANVIIGSLNGNKDQNAKFLIHMKFLKSTNNVTITQTVNDALNILWPNGIKYDHFLVLLTDRAKYMEKAGLTLCGTFPKLTHVFCVAHGLHNV
jgi:hypothetical protein